MTAPEDGFGDAPEDASDAVRETPRVPWTVAPSSKMPVHHGSPLQRLVDLGPARDGAYAPPPRAEPETRGSVRSILIPSVLFVLTVLSTIYVGGVAFSATLMTILVAHEAGHYIMARRHRVPASLPHFIPLPVSFIGTFGAVIGMRSDQATRNQLMDIGAAGPICGFLVAIPAMIAGIELSTPILLEPGRGFMLGDSILSYALTKLFGPEVPPGWDLSAHPVMVAAWAGFLVTGFNLLPIGQLDGGHVLYAFGPERAERIARIVHRALIVLGIFGLIVQGPSILWSIMGPESAREYVSLELLDQTRPLFRFFTPGFLFIALLTRLIGIGHPPARELDRPLTPARRWTALACVAIWVLAFMPNPAWQDAPWLTPEVAPPTQTEG